jgi:hypothetical protein
MEQLITCLGLIHDYTSIGLLRQSPDLTGRRADDGRVFIFPEVLTVISGKQGNFHGLSLPRDFILGIQVQAWLSPGQLPACRGISLI